MLGQRLTPPMLQDCRGRQGPPLPTCIRHWGSTRLTLLQGTSPAAAGRPPHREGAGEEHVAGEGLLEAGAAGKGRVSPAAAQAFIREGPLECFLGGLWGRAETPFKVPASPQLSILLIPKELNGIPGKTLSGQVLQCPKAQVPWGAPKLPQGGFRDRPLPSPPAHSDPRALVGEKQERSPPTHL